MSIKIMALVVGHLYFYGYLPLLAKSGIKIPLITIVFTKKKVNVDVLGFVMIKQGSTFQTK